MVALALVVIERVFCRGARVVLFERQDSNCPVEVEREGLKLSRGM